jgi:hypothetical protein
MSEYITVRAQEYPRAQVLRAHVARSLFAQEPNCSSVQVGSAQLPERPIAPNWAHVPRSPCVQ